MHTSHRRGGIKRTVSLLFATSLIAALSACGSSGGEAAPQASESDKEAGLALAQERLDALYAGFGNVPSPESPPIAEGKTLALIPYDMSYGFSSLWADRAKQAGETLGWNIELTDGKSNPDEVINAIRGAIARKVDGIGVQVFDCNLIQAALDDAIKADIPVIADQGFDCEQPKFTHTVQFAPGLYPSNDGSMAGFLGSMGRAPADWLTVKTKGEAKIIELHAPDSKAAIYQAEGFESELKEVCPACVIVEKVPINLTDAGPVIQQKVAAALIKNQDATVVSNTIADYVMSSGAGAAIQASPNYSKLIVTGQEGAEPNMDMIRAGGPQQQAQCQDNGWDAYTMLDDFNHIFNDLEPAQSGMGITMIDKDHNLNPTGACIVQKDGEPLDYIKAFTEAWTNAR